MPQEYRIGDDNYTDFLPGQIIDGELKRHGLIPRPRDTRPHGYYAGETAVDFPLIPRSEWSDRIKDMEANKSRLSDIRGNIPARDQDGKGFCWAHSSVSASLLLRARDGQPYVDLSAYAVACIIKGYKDEGGWGAESMDWIMANGVPSSQFWPQQSMSASNDTPAMRQNAKEHRIAAGFWDLSVQEYDRNLTFDQLGTLLLSRVPVVVDYNWWSHSVCACDLVETSPGQYGVRILNSWGDSWSDRGMGVLVGQKAIPDGAVAPRVAFASET